MRLIKIDECIKPSSIIWLPISRESFSFPLSLSHTHTLSLSLSLSLSLYARRRYRHVRHRSKTSPVWRSCKIDRRYRGSFVARKSSPPVINAARSRDLIALISLNPCRHLASLARRAISNRSDETNSRERTQEFSNFCSRAFFNEKRV